MTILLGVVTDEVSQDPQEALAWASEQGLDYVDIREVWGKNICDLPEDKILELAGIISQSGLPVKTICPQLFRAELVGEDVARMVANPALIAEDDSEYAQHLRLLERALKIAAVFNAPYVRTFAFWREEEPEDVWADLVAAFVLPVQMAREAGRILLLENEAVSYAISGQEAAQLLNAVASPALAAIWDPGNAFFHDEVPYPDGYMALGRLIRLIHAKDASEKGFSVIGQGKIDWDGQIAALLADGYSGCISVEPRTASAGGTLKDASAGILAYLQQKLG